MIVGVGVDHVDIAEFNRLVRDVGPCFVEKTFSQAEIADAEQCAHRRAQEDSPQFTNARNQYLAGRFAVKEAVFKALAHATTTHKAFDFRMVQSSSYDDGAPYVILSDELRRIMDEAGATHIHVSITNENNLATAFVIAEKV